MYTSESTYGIWVSSTKLNNNTQTTVQSRKNTQKLKDSSIMSVQNGRLKNTILTAVKKVLLDRMIWHDSSLDLDCLLSIWEARKLAWEKRREHDVQ